MPGFARPRSTAALRACRPPPAEQFASWEYEKRAKRKGGRVYIDVRGLGEVVIQEGYPSQRDAKRVERAAQPAADKPKRSEIASGMQTYVDGQRRAVVAAALTDHPCVALRLMMKGTGLGAARVAIRDRFSRIE